MQALVKVCRAVGAAAALMVFVGGCCGLPGDQTPTTRASAQVEQGRAVAALNRVNAIANVSARIAIDPSDRPTAWSWADGTVCVSRGFIQRTSDEELTAVIAHELGHLCLARDGVTAADRFGFRGDGSLVIEHQADVVAVRLLKHVEISPDALQHALAIVRDAPQTSVETKKALDQRINLLIESE